MDEDENQKKAKLILDEVLKKSHNHVRKEREESAALKEAMDEDEYQKKAKLIVDEVLKNSLNHVRKEREESESLREEMDIEAIVDVTLQQSVTAVREGITSPTDKQMSQMAKHLDIKEIPPVQHIETIMMTADGKPEWIEKPDGAIPNADNPKKTKKNIFERLLDSILGRNKKNTKTNVVYTKPYPKTQDISSDASSGVLDEGKRPPSTRKRTRGWFRKNVFLCCVKNTATVEPMDD